MAMIFISYSRNDVEKVDGFVDSLEDAGHKVWIDRKGISGGKKWRKQIVNAIDESAAFIVFLSWDSIDSQNVETELTLAHDKRRHIIPVLLEQVDIPQDMEFQLAGLHQIDCSESSEVCIDHVLEALQDESEEVEDYVEEQDEEPEEDQEEDLDEDLDEDIFEDTEEERVADILDAANADLSIGLLGAKKHGKRTLKGAIKAYIETGGEWCKQPEGNYIFFPHGERTMTVDEIDTSKWLDEHIKQKDALILVVSLEDGILPETKRHIKAIYRSNKPFIGVFLNKTDIVDDEELWELVESEIRYLLDSYGFNGEDMPIIHGSALRAIKKPARQGKFIKTILDWTTW